jgi:hypothetical protein
LYLRENLLSQLLLLIIIGFVIYFLMVTRKAAERGGEPKIRSRKIWCVAVTAEYICRAAKYSRTAKFIAAKASAGGLAYKSEKRCD